jgi:hypothetical protein
MARGLLFGLLEWIGMGSVRRRSDAAGWGEIIA